MRKILRPLNLLLFLFVCLAPAGIANAGIDVSVTIAPPALPVYAQPPIPGDGYIWTPGYWAWGPAGYFWVSGVWVRPPRVGVLWTPGYWGFDGGAYLWHAGYWGPHVGFYGGINYGFGYGGVGFAGGMWRGGVFAYNTAVWNVNRAVVRNVYVDRTVVRNVVGTHASFNGAGGIMARPSAQEQGWAREQHFQATSEQLSHQHAASQDRNQFYSANHGRPGTVAMNSVNARRNNQQQRVANGIASGRMSAGRAAKVEGKEQNINRRVAADRAANGGKLNPQERQNVNKQQNQASRQIYRDKHDGKETPK